MLKPTPNKDTNKDMEFDLITGNPPYSGDLHLEIFNKAFDLLKENGHITFIQPATAYFNKNPIKTLSKHIVAMQKTVSENVSSIIIKPNGIFGKEVRLQLDFAISTIQKSNSPTKNIDSITYKNSNTYLDVPLKYISMTNIPPNIIKNIYEKYERYIAIHGSLDDYTSKDIPEVKARLPRIRGTFSTSEDWYTFLPLTTKDRLVYMTPTTEGFGIKLLPTETIKNLHDYLESTIARFGLTFHKCSQNTTTHEFSMVPKVDFSKTHSDDELQEMLQLSDTEVEIMTTVLAGKYSRK